MSAVLAVPHPTPTARGASRAVGVLGLVAVPLLVLAVPEVAGTGWGAVAGALGGIGAPDLVLLTALWAAGLWSVSWVLTGSLPGLGRRRALLLNLSGSAVAGVLPLGGAFGVALNTAMLRGWGHRPRRIAAFVLTSNAVDVASKLVVCALALALACGDRVQPGLRAALPALAPASAVAVLALVATAAVAARPRGAARLGRALDAVLGRVAAARRRPRVVGEDATWAVRLQELRATVLATARPNALPLAAGALGYLALQAALLTACLHLAGARLPVALVLAAFAVDRLTSTIPLTPSGAGFAEAAVVGLLVSAGGAAGAGAGVVAGVLLYRAFVVVLEVPVGGLLLGGWWLNRRRAATRGGAGGVVRAGAPVGVVRRSAS